MQLQILYKFMEDRKFYTCYASYDQYKNFKKLSIIKECKIIKRNQEIYEKYIEEMQIALSLAEKNDTSYIKKLSESV